MNEINDVRSYNIGSSEYSHGHKWQVWDIWIALGKYANPFDCDILKRILRIKKSDGRLLDYQKCVHICKERIRQFDENINPYIIGNSNITVEKLHEMLSDYDITDEDKQIVELLIYPNVENRVKDYEKIIELCEKRIKELEKEEIK